ncbi:MAG: multifunctional oxoglutarate decarboxylase/oxoglutarate dehydrogenase thiamine pyrophosphate-binding subunit/dihydrolipoyllysine-residue succinyltransferase subunit [Planctomycetes bacterium]|nr:multifunctional oxoglutarate decarboxylase/oxoglutarate dehydrogenase thiamine pyrophosphate-binding subunit/dihydrolipoyllysine-residue succinyltransferase subunit [Planctomycetota bacterium]
MSAKQTATPIDFEAEYGVNAGYVQALFDDWKHDAASVDSSWQSIFERLERKAGATTAGTAAHDGAPSAPPAGVVESASKTTVEGTTTKKKSKKSASKAKGTKSKDPVPAAPAAAESPEPTDTTAADPAAATLEPLTGVAGRIVTNMEASLSLPVATSVRTISAKVLTENRQILNEHLQIRALGKASYTHLIAFALVQAIGENTRLVASYTEDDGKGQRKVPEHVNLGLAIDVPGPKGRMLVVPSIKCAETMNFAEFHTAYEDLVRRGRDGALTTADYQNTNVTLTNPGGFGTEMSVPRLMKGQGLIIATGTIGVPPHVSGASPESLAEIAVGPVMTMTSTYDHRVIQGAESGLLLKRVEALLNGADGFYDSVFRAFRVPWKPYAMAKDQHDPRRDDAHKQAAVWSMINAYRVRGCRLADLDPLEYAPAEYGSLDPSNYGFTIWDLDRSFLCGGMTGRDRMTLREILTVLRRTYCRRWSVEYMHVVERQRKHWVRDYVESEDRHETFERDERLEIYERLILAEHFEQFLHTKYVGNKRFSLEGADSLIPALADAIERAAGHGVEKVIIGMAHRGRLNVLANILGKSYAQIFREFEGVLLPLSTEGSGDVKYHLGAQGIYETRDGKRIDVFLSPNPSHLEAVDPVVCGITRAAQDQMGDVERKKVLAILIHGDAAFSGQGVVAETLNMSRLRAYANGGTIHFVVNNQIGFTASPKDLRSTHFCTDIAKGVTAPIMHANGDYPESVLRAMRVAIDFRHEFGEDAVVDMVCYRRWGHNEGDEPAYTQPVLYQKIRNHPTVAETYRNLLMRRGGIEESVLDEIVERCENELREARKRATEDAEKPTDLPREEILDLDDDEPVDYVTSRSPDTGVDYDDLVEIIDESNKMPAGHVTHPNLLRQLRRREQMVRGESGVDWGCAEALAFGSLLRDSVSIRIAGQDSGRGTFSHRHAVIHDQITGAEHVPMTKLARGGARFEAWDSLLSEEAALAFEFGFSFLPKNRQHLVIWEAQFGDFVNGAQIPIDQFIVSSHAKWKRSSGLTLLLPHGYDGQGPEHSSARPERFLQLCSGGNITVANCTTTVQYFHLIRRQGLSGEPRPLVVMTPKSLLRDKRAASDAKEFTDGRFEEVLEDTTPPKKASRILYCTGKVYYDLLEFRSANDIDDVEIVRVEQLYPIPLDHLLAIARRNPKATLVWVQEEPRNMGAWTFMLQRFLDRDVRLQYAGRPESPSPATGSYSRHKAEQEHLVHRAFGRV